MTSTRDRAPDVRRLVGGDRYDLAAIACVVVGVVLALVVGPWYAWLVAGALAGNVFASVLRRRAGEPDRSGLGRLRTPPSGTGVPREPRPARSVGPGPGTVPGARAEPPRGRPRTRRAGTAWREGRRRAP